MKEDRVIEKYGLTTDDKPIVLPKGHNVVSMIFKGRDGIQKAALFHPITKRVETLCQVIDETNYYVLPDNHVAFIYSTVVDNPKEPLMLNGRVTVDLEEPLWEAIGRLVGEQLEDLSDIKGINAVSKMLLTLAEAAKQTDKTIEIFEELNKQINTSLS